MKSMRNISLVKQGEKDSSLASSSLLSTPIPNRKSVSVSGSQMSMQMSKRIDPSPCSRRTPDNKRPHWLLLPIGYVQWGTVYALDPNVI